MSILDIIVRNGYILGQVIYKLLLSHWIRRQALESLAHERRRDVEVVGRRVIACLIDCSLAALLSSAAFAPLLLARSGLVLILVLLLVFVLLFCVLYFAHAVVFEGLWGKTLGKAILGIEVIRSEDGGVPGQGRAALRALTFLFVDMLVGIFVMLASPRRQRSGDMAAGTLVVRKRRC
jgi:uncharacterized RDD family membrane protein YckC